MNWKPTLWKTIILILLIIITDIYLSSQIIVLDAPSNWYDFIFEPMILIVSLIIGILIYIIWSLFQKKR